MSWKAFLLLSLLLLLLLLLCDAALLKYMICVYTIVCMWTVGVVLYLLPMGAGQSKGQSSHGWGTPLHSFWCCYGSSVESFAKLQDSIYFYR